MVESYAEGINKSIQQLEIDKEFDKFTRRHMRKVVNAFGIIICLMLLPLSGCESYYEFSQEYGIDKNKIYRILNSCSPTSWMRLLRRISSKLLVKIVKKYHSMSPSTRSRYRVTLVVDSTTLLKLAKKLGLAGIFWSGSLKRKARGIQLVVLYAVIGEGKLLIPLDIRIRKPSPKGRGRRCKEQPALVIEMIRDFKRRMMIRGIDPEGWFLVMDSWYGSGDLLREIEEEGFMVVFEGKRNYVFYRDGRKMKVAELIDQIQWRDSSRREFEYGRVNADSPTFGEVTLLLFEEEGKIRYLITRRNLISAVRIIVAYKLRWWIEELFKILKSCLKIEKFGLIKEREVYGHICLRMICFMVVCFCARRICRETIQKLVRKLKRYWFEWFPEILNFSTFSRPSSEEAA